MKMRIDIVTCMIVLAGMLSLALLLLALKFKVEGEERHKQLGEAARQATVQAEEAKRQATVRTQSADNARIIAALTSGEPIFGEENASSGQAFYFSLRVNSFDAARGTVAGEMDYYKPNDGAIMTFEGCVSNSTFKFASKNVVKRGTSDPGVNYTVVFSGGNMQGTYTHGFGRGKVSLWLDRTKREQFAPNKENRSENKNDVKKSQNTLSPPHLTKGAPVAQGPDSNERATTPSALESPTGKDPRSSTGLLAFVARQGRERGIFVMRPDGSCLRSLTTQFTDAFAPTWSPDGVKIVFRAGGVGDLYVIDADGGNLRKVLDLGEVVSEFPGMESFRLNVDAKWLPDGKTIAACIGSWPDSSKIYLIDAASLKRTSLPLAKAAWDVAWSPDGTRIAFVTYNATGDQKRAFQVWLSDANGSHQVALWGPCDVQAGPIWLADSKRLIFIQEGGWADGKQNNELCMKNVEDGAFIQTDFSWDVDGIVASPDGRKIAFSPLHASPVYVFQLTGSVWRQWTTIEDGECPTWSPDGTSLAFVSSDDHQIWLANADGTGRIKLNSLTKSAVPVGSESPAGAGASDVQKERPEWSPAGTWPSNTVLKLAYGAVVIPTDETREIRTWTMKSEATKSIGTIKASLVDEHNGIVLLKREDGSKAGYSETVLSDADKHYLQDIKKELFNKSKAGESSPVTVPSPQSRLNKVMK